MRLTPASAGDGVAVIHVVLPPGSVFAGLAAAGIVVGLVLLVRGFAGYRAAGRISGTAPSRIASIAAGEVLVTGAAEPIELTLVSPLQSQPAVYYRSRITESSDGNGPDLFREDRAVGFRVRDATGSVRVFPNGARFDVPDRYDESTPMWGGDPIGLMPRTGSMYAPGPDDREARIAALISVPDARAWSLLEPHGLPMSAGSSGRRHYREARIEPGDPVTVVGRALPFGDLADPAGSNFLDGNGLSADDPEVAADLAAARAAGLLADSPVEAWGNAAIEGFGIGRPVRTPVLDPAADRPPAPDPALAARVAETFEIDRDSLVLATAADLPLLISLGSPSTVAGRDQWQFVLGMLGAVLAIASAMGLALVMNGGIR